MEIKEARCQHCELQLQVGWRTGQEDCHDPQTTMNVGIQLVNALRTIERGPGIIVMSRMSGSTTIRPIVRILCTKWKRADTGPGEPIEIWWVCLSSIVASQIALRAI